MPEALVEVAPPDSYSELKTIFKEAKSEPKPKDDKLQAKAPDVTGGKPTSSAPPQEKAPAPVSEKQSSPLVSADAGVSKPAATPAAPVTDEKQGPKELREAYEKTKRRLVELESKLTDYDETSTKYKALAEQHEKASTRLNQLEETLKFTDYTQSDEYKRTYVEPLSKSAEALANEFLDWEGDDGTKVNQEHLKAVLYSPKTKEWRDGIQKIFGLAAPEVMAYRTKHDEFTRKAREAVDDFKRTAGEREKQQRVQADLQRASLEKAYRAQLEQLTSAEPTIYNAVDGDEEGNEMLDKGYAFVDTTLDNSSDLTLEVRAKNYAIIRSKAGAFDRVNHKLSTSQKRIAELEAELEKYRNGDKAGVQSGAPANPSQVPDANEAIAAMFRR